MKRNKNEMFRTLTKNRFINRHKNRIKLLKNNKINEKLVF